MIMKGANDAFSLNFMIVEIISCADFDFRVLKNFAMICALHSTIVVTEYVQSLIVYYE